MRLFLSLTVAALLVVACVFALGINQGFAKHCPPGTYAASWYGLESCHPGRRCRTATGERFTGRSFTAAMPSPKHLGEHWLITWHGRSVTVRINDVGPARWTHRSIDLAEAVARALGTKGAGVACIGMKRL